MSGIDDLIAGDEREHSGSWPPIVAGDLPMLPPPGAALIQAVEGDAFLLVSGPAGAQGPQGPQGPTGPQGPIGDHYLHTQSMPSATWTVTHGLGRRPNVMIVDSAGDQVLGNLSHPTLNTAVLSFSAPFSGTADFA